VDVKDLEAEIGLLAEIVEFDVDDNEVLDKIRSAKPVQPLQQYHRGAGPPVRAGLGHRVQPGEPPRLLRPGRGETDYPYGTAFAHVLGYVGEASPEEMDQSEDDSLTMGTLSQSTAWSG